MKRIEGLERGLILGGRVSHQLSSAADVIGGIGSGPSRSFVEGKVAQGRVCELLWWSQLVISPLWAQELSLERPLEIASTHTGRQSGSFLPKTCLWILLPPPCHAHPIVQPAFRHAFIPSHYSPAGNLS
jgi:hypothetical protein